MFHASRGFEDLGSKWPEKIEELKRSESQDDFYLKHKDLCCCLKQSFASVRGEKNDGYSWNLIDYDAYKIWIDAITDCLSDEIWRIDEYWNPWNAG